MSSGRAVLAADKGKLLSRLSTMERVARLNRHERDPELEQEIAEVRDRLAEINALETLWTKGDRPAYEAGYILYSTKHAHENRCLRQEVRYR